MKLTTTTLIIIAAIKWTLQTSKLYEELNKTNENGIVEGETNSLDDNQKKVLEMSVEDSYSFSGAREFDTILTEKGVIKNFNVAFFEKSTKQIILTEKEAIKNFNVAFFENNPEQSTHHKRGQIYIVDNSMDCVAQLYQTEVLYQQIEFGGEQYILTLKQPRKLYKIIGYQEQSNQLNPSDVNMQFEEPQSYTTLLPPQETVLINNPNLYASLLPHAMVQEPPKQTEQIAMECTSVEKQSLPASDVLQQAWEMAHLNYKSQSSYKNQERTTPYPIPNKTKVQSNPESTNSNEKSENIWSWIKNQVR